MKPEIKALMDRMTVPRKSEYRLSLELSMMQLVRAANRNRSLLENGDWQGAMVHLNNLMKEDR